MNNKNKFQLLFHKITFPNDSNNKSKTKMKSQCNMSFYSKTSLSSRGHRSPSMCPPFSLTTHCILHTILWASKWTMSSKCTVHAMFSHNFVVSKIDPIERNHMIHPMNEVMGQRLLYQSTMCCGVPYCFCTSRECVVVLHMS